MSRTIGGSDSVSLVPSGYTGLTNLTTSSSYPISNGYDDSSSTNYARLTLSTSSTGYLYFTFDTSDIPSGAEISSIACSVRARVSSTSRVTNTVAQLYSGTTAKGSNSTFASTSSTNTFNLSCGSWTRNELNDLRLRIGGTGSSSSSSKYIYFYGASLTITYTYNYTVYEVTATSNTSDVVSPASQEVKSGEDASITLTLAGSTVPVVTDNGENVTNQLVRVSSGSEVVIPDGYEGLSNFTTSGLNNACTDADDTTYATLTLAGSTTGVIYLTLGGFTLPSGATLESVSCRATFQYNHNNSSSEYTASCQMYSGTTAKGSSTSIVTTGSSDLSKTTFTLTTGSWSAAELANTRLYITATNNARSTQRSLYVYGVSLTVTYSISGIVYVYTVSSVNEDHVIVIGTSSRLYVKTGNSWVAVIKAYKKVSGSWIEQDIATVFRSGVNYVRGS